MIEIIGHMREAMLGTVELPKIWRNDLLNVDFVKSESFLSIFTN